jgi:hypothetical protein
MNKDNLKDKNLNKKSMTSESAENKDNLGLDADHSSDESSRFDRDNDIISHNPDGEDDDRDNELPFGTSPLMDK